MSFKRESLAVLQNRMYSNYTSLYKPLDKTPRHNLLKVFAQVDAGIYHQLSGDLDFLSRQIFPDTAEGEYLREHWSAKVPPLYATTAAGNVEASGLPNRSIPSGLLFSAASGEHYYAEKSHRLDEQGKSVISVKAQNPGAQANLTAGEKLKIISSIPTGVDSTVIVAASGISGGSDAETDEEYQARVLASLRNPNRYGKRGDFALWAMDASPEVSSAWEFYNFGVFGAVLVQVLNGNQMSGVHPVENVSEVQNYISSVAPLIMFEVRSPALVSVNPSVTLPSHEDSQVNRDLAETGMKTFLQLSAKPGVQATAGSLRLAIIDGVTITDAVVKINGSIAGIVSTTILQYPVLGVLTWE